jgi:hypothetical protein
MTNRLSSAEDKSAEDKAVVVMATHNPPLAAA